MTKTDTYHSRKEAKKRGIEWLFIFDEWWQLVKPVWSKRGHGKDAYCMARYQDAGPYSKDNVRMTTNSENAKEAWVVRKSKVHSRERKK